MKKQSTSNQIKTVATTAATNVYNKLGTQTGVAKVPGHIHNGHDANKISYDDLTDQLTATAPLSISSSNVISVTLPASIPTGTILMYGSYSSIPTGYLLCDGNSYDPTVYAALFAVIGYEFGTGVGSNFCVPYMSGRVPVGATSNAGLGGGANGIAGTRPTGGNTLTQYAVGQWQGEETHVLSTGEMPAHAHNLGIVPTGGASGVIIPNATNSTTPGNSEATDSQGGGGAHNTLQPVMALAFIIKT